MAFSEAVRTPISLCKTSRRREVSSTKRPYIVTTQAATALATALEIVKVERKYQDEKIEDLKGQLQEAKDIAEEYRQSLRSSEVKLIGVMEKMSEADNKRVALKGVGLWPRFWKRLFG